MITFVKKWSPLSLLKILLHTSWGFDNKTLLLLYKSLIRSVLDDSYFLFDSASSSHLKNYRIHYAGLRWALGTLFCTHIYLLEAEVGVMSLSQYQNLLGLKYF